MIYAGEKYIYIGFIKKTHGEKGKLILVPKRRIDLDSVPRIFIKNDEGKIEELRIKRAKKYKEFFILSLSKIRNLNDAMKFISQDVYVKESDLSRKIKIQIGITPEFIQEVQKLPSGLDQIGFITKPRGLQGQVASLIDPDKFHKLKEGSEIYLMTQDGKYYKTQIRSFKKLKNGTKLYVSLKLMNINDVDSAERLRKALLFA